MTTQKIMRELCNSKAYTCSNTDFGPSSILWCNILELKIENFRVRLIVFPFVEFHKFWWSV